MRNLMLDPSSTWWVAHVTQPCLGNLHEVYSISVHDLNHMGNVLSAGSSPRWSRHDDRQCHRMERGDVTRSVQAVGEFTAIQYGRRETPR
ncbi:hypothetical protein VTJ04DRAFT_5951 [Mycothermus thermophilus]|uniref:uncharacterized protein n=1 Tax=Humicola insolens TaxID=85995 RepID=UPI0037425804